MLLSEITYAVLEYLRQGKIVDDERMDIRLIEKMVHVKRAEYLKQLKDSGKILSNVAYQRIVLEFEKYEPVDGSIQYRSQIIPSIINSRFGHLIDEIGSVDIDQYPYNIVLFKQLRVVGNGKFNSDMVYCAYYSPRIYMKSKSFDNNMIDNAIGWIAFEDPTLVDGFDPDVDDYPIDIQGVDFIKESIYKLDVALFKAGKADETNDSSGDI